MFKFWIQKHDYSTIEKNVKSLDQLVKAFMNTKWEKEFDSYEENPELEKDCPPGFAIHNDLDNNKNGILLYLSPIDKEFTFFNLSYKITKRFLFFFPYQTTKFYNVQKYPINKIKNLFELALNLDIAEILSIE